MSASDFDERVLTVPLRKVSAEPSHTRADYAMRLVREHLAKHFKVDEDAVRLDTTINEAVWKRGRAKPPRKLRIRAARFHEAGVDVVEAEVAE